MQYDVIGDVHGCYDEFMTLVEKCGYIIEENKLTHPQGRKLISLGDITDRGPESVKMMKAICDWVEAGSAIYVPGNHCNKLYRFLIGRNVQIKHGLETTVAELENLDSASRHELSERFKKLYELAPLYLILDNSRLVVAHAGIRSEDIGKQGKRIETFVLYGDITGDKRADGRPIRRDWAKKDGGTAWIIYGHTPVKEPRQINRTINIDTGCVFGGALTACRYPEIELVSVPSKQPFIEEKFSVFD